jgi:uncharacterized protein YbcI
MTVTDESPTSSRSSAISKLAIRLMSRYAGRGPNNTRTYFNDDMITIVMRDLLTKPESNLLDNGQTDIVQGTRRAFQQVMAKELIAGVEEITQRKVTAFLSANSVEPDIAVETFILAPAADADRPS